MTVILSKHPTQATRQKRDGSHFYLWNTASFANFPTVIFFNYRQQEKTIVNRLGRGAAFVFHHDHLHLVLRHYQRGGLIRHFNRDLYFFAELHKTRMWREFLLLMHMRALALPVPEPIAAHCHRIGGIFCRGDLITQMIPHTRTLAQALQQQALLASTWKKLGETLAQFHKNGVYHADLNANNILLDVTHNFYLLDFDRGEMRAPQSSWQNSNISRLLRSLHKLQGRHASFYFSAQDWRDFHSAYTAAMVPLT